MKIYPRVSQVGVVRPPWSRQVHGRFSKNPKMCDATGHANLGEKLKTNV